jgi:hypothetical protein
MQDAGSKGAYLPRYFRTTVAGVETRTAPDLVERVFVADGPNKLWVSDFTYVRTDQGFLFLACILDVFSRRIVGWSTSDAMTADLVHAALEMALQRRDGRDAKLIHHSDRGSQGEIKWSSQHLVITEVLSGATSSAASRPSASAGHALTWPADPGPTGRAPVLALDRAGRGQRDGRAGSRRVSAGRDALVSSGWRHAAADSDRAHRALPVVR